MNIFFLFTLRTDSASFISSRIVYSPVHYIPRTVSKARMSETLVPLSDAAALTEFFHDPARVLLLHREPSSHVPKISNAIISFPSSTATLSAVSFEVVVLATCNQGKKVKSSAMIEVHLMADNARKFNTTVSTYSVPSRLVCQHPLVPRGQMVLYFHTSDSSRDQVQPLRVACIVDVIAQCTSVFGPVPVYFKAELVPYAIPVDHEIFTYSADVRSRATNLTTSIDL